MIRRSTVVYIVILFALAGVWYYMNNREEPIAEATPTPEAVEELQYLFTTTDGVVTALHISANTGEVVEVARNADNAWEVIMPIEAVADQASAEAAASQVSGMRILDSVKDIDLDLVGINDPAYILTVTFNTGLERKIKIGVVTPTESGYYVQDQAGGDVMIISKSSLDALLGLLTSPPYLETPTPSPVPTETAAPSATPEAVTPVNETATPQS
jgi:hypothetical protein